MGLRTTVDRWGAVQAAGAHLPNPVACAQGFYGVAHDR